METVLFLALFAAVLPDVTEGKLTTVVGKRVVDVPLEHTDVRIQVSGHLVDATVVQTFRNPYAEKIEAVYLFPLPADAAVGEMEIRIGARRIIGKLMRREKAVRVYERAKKRGHVAALLTQNRPNLFKQSVANIEPGKRIEVRLRYVHSIVQDGGSFELVFPMVAGPRYLPKAGRDEELQPSVLPAEMRSSHEISLAVDLDAGFALREIGSPSHFVEIDRAASRASVRLSPRDVIPNRDFILRYRIEADAPEFAILAHKESDLGYFLLLAQPPLDAASSEVEPRELIFVIDASSSMRGAPIEKGKALIRTALRGLRADDTFTMVRFGDRAQSLSQDPLAHDPRNEALAIQWLDAIEPGGGTEMESGLSTAMSVRHDPMRLRIIVFITDGFIGNEEEVLALVGKHARESRLFSFGVGTAVNRYLLEEMGSIGRGAATVIRPDEPTEPAVERFLERIDRPVLTDLSIEWNGLEVEQLDPARIPDLFVGQPLSIAGRYRNAGKTTVYVQGNRGGVPVRFAVPVELPVKSSRPAVASVWARRRIARLDEIEEVVALALEHRLLTRYTAFVAVDTSTITGGGGARMVPVPVEVPEGLSASGFASGGYGMGIGSLSGGIGAKGAGMSYPMVLMRAEASIDASLDRSDVGAEIKRQLNRLRFCYEKQLAVNPSLQGKLTVKFSIEPGGSVSSISATGLGDAAVETCVANVIRSIRFPESDGLTEVSYPFIFVTP